MPWIDFAQTLDQRLNRVLIDEQQQRIRNFNLNGHTLVRGVAGSGKSLVLANRVGQLLNSEFTNVLVLSYNRFMRGWLSSMLRDDHRVECKTYHKWAVDLGDKNGFEYDFRENKNPKYRKDNLDKIKKVDPIYQAILVDEAQDFFDEWFEATLSVLDPRTNSLFFVYDNTQSVYGQSHRRKTGWSWAKLGIDVIGRSQILELNYRNSPEILELAWNFIEPELKKSGMRYDRRENRPPIDRIIEPIKKTSRSSGVFPIIERVASDLMPIRIAAEVQKARESCLDSSIGILLHPRNFLLHPDRYTKKEIQEKIHQELVDRDIEHDAPKGTSERNGNAVNRPYVIVDSWNALKGVEFDAVIIAGIDRAYEFPWNADKDFEEKAGVYAAITRARDHLIILYENETPIVEKIKSALNSPEILRFED